MQKLSEIVDTMDNTARRVLESKKAALDMGDEVFQQVGEGKDILSTLRMWPSYCPRYSMTIDGFLPSESEYELLGRGSSS